MKYQAMSNAVRAPRPGTDAAMVLPRQKDGNTRAQIERATGLSGDRLSWAISYNYRLGYIQSPSLEQRRRLLRENASAAKGGVWLAIEPYAPLLLTARQTHVALQNLEGRELSLHQIATAYGRERRRNGLERPVKELSIQAQRDKRRSNAEVANIASLRVEARDTLARFHLALPRTLERWNQVCLMMTFADGFVDKDHRDVFLERKLRERYEPEIGDRTTPKTLITAV